MKNSHWKLTQAKSRANVPPGNNNAWPSLIIGSGVKNDFTIDSGKKIGTVIECAMTKKIIIVENQAVGINSLL